MPTHTKKAKRTMELLDDINAKLRENVGFIDTTFGRAWKVLKQVGEREYRIPAVFTDGMDYTDLSPTDEFGNYSFWVFDDAEDLSLDNSGGMTIRKASIIFWIDLRLVNDDVFRSRWTEFVKDTLLNTLSKYATSEFGSFKPEKAYEEPRNVYDGFTIREQDGQFAVQPYYVLRVTGKLVQEFPCETNFK